MKKLVLVVALLSLRTSVFALNHTSLPIVSGTATEDKVQKRDLGLPTSWSQFVEQLQTDTKEVLGKDFSFGYTYNFIGAAEGDRDHFSVAPSVVAWKFLAIAPALGYTTSFAPNKGEVEIVLPIRWRRIPIGLLGEVNDVLPDLHINGWVDHLDIEPVFGQNFTTGRFTLGLRLSYNFGERK